MFIITVAGHEKDGAYSVVDEDQEQVLYIFQEEDDATRYALQLEELDYPEMHVLEIEDEIIKKLIFTFNKLLFGIFWNAYGIF